MSRSSSSAATRAAGLTSGIAAEIAVFAAAAGGLAFELRHLLFAGAFVPSHDNAIWNLPFFAYFADGLLHGHIPLWNPFSHGGEPFFPAIIQERMLDPINLIVIWVAHWFTNDLIVMFDWDWFARCLVASIGIQMLMRRWAETTIVKCTLAIIAVFSTATLSSFHQEGILNQFYTAPLTLFFLFRLLEGNRRWVNFAGFVFFAGQSMQSYCFVGTCTAVLLIALSYGLFDRPALAALVTARSGWIKIAVSVALLILMAAPNLALLAQAHAFHSTLRDVQQGWENLLPNGEPFHGDVSPDKAAAGAGLHLPYGLIRLTGSFARFRDFLGLVAAPYFIRYISEAYLFIGGLAFLLALIGIFAGTGSAKRHWLTILIGFGLVNLGANTPAHWLIYQVYPPLWFLRHTELLGSFVVLALIYFFVLGANRVLALGQPLFSPTTLGTTYRVLGILALAAGIAAVSLLGDIFAPVPVDRFRPDWIAFTALAIVIILIASRLGGLSFAGIFAGLVAAALLVSIHRVALAAWIVLFTLIPALVIYLCRQKASLRRRSAAGATLFLATLAELAFNGHLIVAYEAMPRAVATANLPLTVGGSPFPSTRIATLDHPPTPEGHPQRTSELLARVGAVFDTPADYPDRAIVNDVQHMLAVPHVDSLILLDSYWRLVHADLKAETIAAIFGVDAPMVQFRPRAEIVDDPLGALRAEGTADLLATTVLIDPLSLPPGGLPSLPPSNEATATIEDFQPRYDGFSVSVANRSPGYLVIANADAPGWLAQSGDGEALPVLRADGGFIATPIAAAPARVIRFRYRPEAILWSIGSFYAGLILAMLVALIDCWAKPRHSGDTTLRT